MRRPADLVDREWEWDALARFVEDDRVGATLGVVSGRRRQGKSYLLQAACEAVGGLYFEAIEGPPVQALRHLGDRIARWSGAPARLAFEDWGEAVAALLALGRERPTLVVIDELPYLIAADPALPSLIQAAYAPRDPLRRASRTRLLLCGSAMSVMGRLLGGDAPLRGRAGLELVVPTFDYRLAASFWGLETQPRLALMVHAIVGGTPAYRREFVGDDAPTGPDDFDAWVVRSVLNPAVPLFREGRYLLTEEPDLRDTALYRAVLSAIASGRTRRGEIAAALGRATTDIGHPLTVLQDAGFIVRREDQFRKGRPTFAIVEPIVRFYHGLMRPRWARLERPGRGAEVWREAQHVFASSILGPHFEQVCRAWTGRFATEADVGAAVAEVGWGTVNDPANRTRHELDVVARDADGNVVLIGEAKWGRAVGPDDLVRLEHLRGLLAARGLVDPSRCRLALFGGAGYAAELESTEALLVDPARLYGL